MLISSHNFSPLEGVDSCSQSISQSQARMQNRDCTSSPREVGFPCSGRFDQSQLSMQMRYAKPEVFDQTHCLRPYISESSHAMDTSNNLSQNATLNSTLNISNTYTNTIDFANNTLDYAFQKIFNLIANIPHLFHYDASNASRVKRDASHSGLGACLEQEVEPNGSR